jgi:hypothetical protein
VLIEQVLILKESLYLQRKNTMGVLKMLIGHGFF